MGRRYKYTEAHCGNHKSNRLAGKMKTLFAVSLLIFTFACASFSNKENYVKLQNETPTTCVYGRHGTQTDNHSDFAVSKSDLGLGGNERCAEWITKVCENVRSRMDPATENGLTVMLTTYSCDRETINGRVVRPMRP